MVVGEIAEQVDLLIAGGGPGGYAAAIRGAQLGRSVLLVDRDGETGLGGACLHVGCIPSKSLIEVADTIEELKHWRKAGLSVQGTRFELSEWQERRKTVVDGLASGIRQLLRNAGVTVLAGELRLTRPDRAVVETATGQAQFFDFEHLVLATGSRASALRDLPRDGVHVLDSTDALNLDVLPASVVVVGGGYIGVELGTAFSKLGVQVTIVEAEQRLLPAIDENLVRPVSARLSELGASILTHSEVIGFDGETVKVSTPQGETGVSADKVVVAVGRTPNTDDIGLDLAGIVTLATGLLDVAPNRSLTNKIAAIGDITPGPALAHKATAEALVAVAAQTGQQVRFDPLAIPVVIFSDPQIASAGLSQAEAQAQGLDATATIVPLSTSGRAALAGGRSGSMQMVVDRLTRVVVGVHIVGPVASELIAEGVVAIEMGATAQDLASCIRPHPTFSEQFSEVAHLAEGFPVNVMEARRGKSA